MQAILLPTDILLPVQDKAAYIFLNAFPSEEEIAVQITVIIINIY
jgi:hypothetical protein